MKKIVAMVVMLFAFAAAQAVEVGYTVGSVKARDTNVTGSVMQVAVQNGRVGAALQSLTIANANRTEADVTYTLTGKGIHATAGLGGVTQTGVKTHAVYLGEVGYDYAFENKWTAGAAVGYKNDFERVVHDRQVTYTAKASYAFSDATSVGLAYTRYNGDLRLNSLAVACTTKF